MPRSVPESGTKDCAVLIDASESKPRLEAGLRPKVYARRTC